MIRHGSAPYLECSSFGDRRFSALCAMVDGVSIEQRYQSAKRLLCLACDGNGFIDESICAPCRGTGKRLGLSVREAKGRKAINQAKCNALYSQLWDQYIKEHPKLLVVLKSANGLSDRFGQLGHCCQATELWRIRNA